MHSDKRSIENTRVIVFTQTYNSENTLERCINSILNQTHRNIVYYIADNASNDDTREIIQSYAEKDSRIIPIYCSDNLKWQAYSVLPMILEQYDRHDCFAVLDHDDEYDVMAFEMLLRFMQENTLDIAACMGDFINAIDGRDLNMSNLSNDLIISGTYFETHFPNYFKFMRDPWGKLYSLSTFYHLDFNSFDPTFSRGSTTFLYCESLKNAERFGVLAQRIYKYYIYPHSLEHAGSTRITVPMVYNYYRDWIIAKCGRISEQNKLYLFDAYFKAIRNRTLLLLKSAAELTDKLSLLEMVFSNDMTMDMLCCEHIGEISTHIKLKYIGTILEWIDSQNLSKDSVEPFLSAQVISLLEGIKTAIKNRNCKHQSK